MKKLALALFFVATVAQAQFTNFAHHGTASAGHANGLPAAAFVGPYSGTPVLGDLIYFNGTNWVSLNKPADGTYSIVFTAGIPSYTAAAGGGALLSASDAVNTAPVRGGIVVANSTPKWAQVAVGGNGTFLGSNGTDPSWTTPGVTAPVTYSANNWGLSITTTNDGGAIVKQASSPGTQQTSANINVNGTVIEEKDALATTPAGGYTAQNTTAAAAGAQQVSPPVTLCGQGWGTTGSTNETDCWHLYNLPVQGTTSNSALTFDVSLAGGAYTNRFSLSSNGTLTMPGPITASGSITSSLASATFALTGGMGAGVGGVSELTGQGGTTLLTGQSQLMTLNTGGTLTTSTGTLLPAGAVIYAVTGRVTTTITTASAYSIGSDTPSNATRFCSTGNALTAGTTFVCLNAVNCGNTTCSATNGMAQTAAGNITITTTGTPGAGAIRVQVYYFLLTPPTS